VLHSMIKGSADINRLWQACRSADRDGSGKLTPSELAAAVTSSTHTSQASPAIALAAPARPSQDCAGAAQRSQAAADNSGVFQGLVDNAGYVDYRTLTKELQGCTHTLPSAALHPVPVPRRSRPASAQPRLRDSRGNQAGTSADRPAQPAAVAARKRPSSARPSRSVSCDVPHSGNAHAAVGVPTAGADDQRACHHGASGHEAGSVSNNTPRDDGIAYSSGATERRVYRPAVKQASLPSMQPDGDTSDTVPAQHKSVKAGTDQYMHEATIAKPVRPQSAPLRRTSAVASSNPNDLTQRTKSKVPRPSSASIRGVSPCGTCMCPSTAECQDGAPLYAWCECGALQNGSS
jgi:hypothetical protein